MMRPARATGYLVALFLLDILFPQVALQVAMQLRYILPLGRIVLPEWAAQLFYAPTLWLHLVVLILWTTSLILASAYTPRRVAFWGEELQRLVLGHTVAALLLAGVLYLTRTELPRLSFAYFYLISLVLMVGARLVLRGWHWARRTPAVQSLRVLVAGDGSAAATIIEQMRSLAWPGFELIGTLGATPGGQVAGLPVLGTLEDAAAVIDEQRADALVIALPRGEHETLAHLVARLNKLPVRLYIVPDYFDLAFFDATIERLGTIPLIGLRDPAIDGLQRILKRLMDIGLSSLLLLFLSGFLGLLALLIKLEDGGPVIYRAPRVGENGQLFHMLKFRSMVVGADRLEEATYLSGDAQMLTAKRADDPRVTRIGRWMRRWNVDELPQLVNVLRGDMSLVGPRPELPWLTDRYADWQHKRFAVPQGMTGWWQINGREESSLAYLHTDEDLYYVQNYSLWLDIQILWKTLAVVLRGKGAL
jgi:exopolysaccharide biosynthesis polyprenyl glycosylphosphotransferase